MKTPAQPNPIPFSGSTALTLTGSNTYYSDPVSIMHMEGGFFQLILAGQPNGTASIQVSADPGTGWWASHSLTYANRSYDIVNWTTITSPTTTVQAFSSPGVISYNLSSLYGLWLRLKVVSSNVLNQTGSLTGSFCGKGPQ